MPRFAILLAASLALLPTLAHATAAADLAASIRAATTGAPDFTISAPTATTPMVNAADWSVLPSNDGATNLANLQRVLRYCHDTGVHSLVFGPGTYALGDATAARPPDALIELNGFTDFTFDGAGADFVCQAKTVFVELQNGQRVVMENYSVDWDWSIAPVQSLGCVSDIAPDGSWLRLYFPSESNPTPSIPYELVEVDPTTYNFIHQGMGVVGKANITSVTAVGGSVLQYTAAVGFFTKRHAAVGQYYVARNFEYDHPGTKVTSCSDVTFQRAVTYSTLGMGYIFRYCDHIQFQDSKIVRRAGTNWPWRFSSAADGIHFENNYGYIKLQNVEIGNAGDDAINIHDTLSQGIAPVSGHPNQLRVTSGSTWQYPFAKGDPVQLRRDDFSPVGFESALTAAPTYANGKWTLTFAEPVPAALPADTIVFNERYRSDNYIVRHCNIHDNKVRGMVVHNANGTIENNTITGNYSPGLFIITVSTAYKEGSHPTNIIVRNNVFDGNDIKRQTFLSMPNNVVIAAETPQHKPVNFGLCDDIIVEGNIIKNCPYAALEVASASNVLVANNTIVNPNLFNDLPAVTGSVMILDASDVVATNNRLIVEPGVQSYRTNLSVENATTSDVDVEPLAVRGAGGPRR